MKALLFQKLPLGLTVSLHLRCLTRGLCKPLNVKLTFCVHELHLPLLIPVLPHTVAPSSQVVADSWGECEDIGEAQCQGNGLDLVLADFDEQCVDCAGCR